LPANLPPEYFRAEEKYLTARSTEEKMKALEEMLRIVPKHKGTENLRALLKRRMAKLKEEMEKKAGKKGGERFYVKKEGAAQVALLGMPNCGKSTLLSSLTNARVEIANYPFTTLRPTPGMMEFNEVQIQLVEIPGIIRGASLGKGMGPALLSAARNSDGITLVLDLSNDPEEQYHILMEELNRSGIRLNENPPNIKIERRGSGGIEIRGLNKIRATESEVISLLREYGVYNALVVINEKCSLEELSEALDERLVYRRCRLVGNKLDLPESKRNLRKLERNIKDEIIAVSAKTKENLERLKREIFGMLNLIRVYTKTPGGKIRRPPVVLRKGATVEDVAKLIHSEIARNMRFARVWGNSVKYPGQHVGRDHVLMDGDVVELH